MNKSKISYLAIASLVSGTAFYIPIASGISAILLGIFAVKTINKSEGLILGKGIALTGIGLGAIHGAVWLLVFFAGLTFTVHEGQSAVVLRGGDVQRVEEGGIHYKIPFIDSIEYYPTGDVQSLESNAGELLFFTKELHSLNYMLLWNVCSADKAYVAYGRFRSHIVEELLSYKLKRALRLAAAKNLSPNELINDYTQRSLIEKKLSDEISASGICITSFTLSKS